MEDKQEEVRFWALKTTSGGDLEKDYWQNFVAENVVALGWGRISVDPSQVSDEKLQDATRMAYPDKNYRGIAGKIRKFVDLKPSNRILICRGYSGNQTTPVHIYGIARVTGPFRDDSSSQWWRFKHDAFIQIVEQNVPKEVVARSLGKGSLREAIHELNAVEFQRLVEKLGVNLKA
ncbi:MAG: hypothetical protein HY753_04960 [Nitrospirae bacterium]|nr:hypothetical protein [Nitrospirota bacterium]